MSEILQKTMEAICESLVLESSEINENTLIITDLEADSLDIMDIMFILEDKFNIKLQKEDFNFLTQIGMEREQAVDGEFLVGDAKKKLKEWLPALEVDQELKPSDLGKYLSVHSIVKLVGVHLGNLKS